MLLQLKQDVDYLKDVVAKAGLGRPSVPALAAPEDVLQDEWKDREDASYDSVRPEYLSSDEDPEEQDFQEKAPQDLSIKAASQDLIERVLAKHDGNRKAAAAELGISERTLYRKIKQMTEK